MIGSFSAPDVCAVLRENKPRHKPFKFRFFLFLFLLCIALRKSCTVPIAPFCSQVFEGYGQTETTVGSSLQLIGDQTYGRASLTTCQRIAVLAR